ncbi:MAG: ribosome hibernation-promoting factor, HPF/YfiA family [Gammaproteobacteria bacterium]
MQITVTGRHFDVTDPIRNYVNEKMERLERHFDHVHEVDVVLSVEKLDQKAEATVHVNGNTLHAEAHHEDLYAALDALIDKLDRQVRKYKEKLTDHHRSESVKRDI